MNYPNTISTSSPYWMVDTNTFSDPIYPNQINNYPRQWSQNQIITTTTIGIMDETALSVGQSEMEFLNDIFKIIGVKINFMDLINMSSEERKSFLRDLKINQILK
jgi:hypothetical protein